MRTAGLFLFVLAELCGALAAPSMAAASGPTPIKLNVEEGLSGCVYGSGPGGAALTITIKTPHGEQRGRQRIRINRFGDWTSCTASKSPINAGDRIVIRTGAQRLVFRVPLLTVTVDPSSGVVSGRAPAGHNVTVFVGTSERTVRSDSHGKWRLPGSQPPSAFTLAAARLIVGWNTVEALGVSPRTQILRGDNVVRGITTTLAPIHVRLFSRTGQLRSRVTVQSSSLFWSAALMDARGRATYPEPGDVLRISSEPKVRLRIPDGRIHGESATDTVTGRCMPNAEYIIDAVMRHAGVDVTGRTTSSGGFTHHLSVDLLPGASLALGCQYPSGDFYFANNLSR